MNIGSDEKIHVARFLNFILGGEKLAHICAAQQANITDDRYLKRFLIGQSKQEKLHANTFSAAILWLAPKGVNCPAQKHIKNYQSILQNSIHNHELSTSILGLQVLLEGMGDIVLNRFNHGLNLRGAGYNKIRKTFLAQEDSHHTFGLNYMHETLKSKTLSEPMYQRSLEHQFLIMEMLETLRGLFDFFEEDTDDYIAEFEQNLPQWIHLNALDNHTCT